MKYLIQVLGTDSSEVHSPKCASSFKLSSINQAKESRRTKVIDEYLWRLPPKCIYIYPCSKFNKKDAHNILYSSISASPIVRIPAGTAV